VRKGFLFILFVAAEINTLYAEDLSYKPGELIVRFRPKANGNQLTVTDQNIILASIGGGNVKHSFKLLPGLCVVKLPANKTVENALIAFKRFNGILYAEPNYRIRLLSTFPNDPRFDEQWGLHNTGQTGGTPDADIDAPEAWDTHTGSNSIIVAVLDTGIDRNHPDLLANMWINTGEIPDNNEDDDGNWYVDDVYGYDFGNDDNDRSDYRWHGTHCAGIVGAVGNNSQGGSGVCWDVTIMNVKICKDEGSTPSAWVDMAIEGIEYAVMMGADVLSCSWRIYDLPPRFFVPEALKYAVEAAGNEGVIVVASAGNDGENIDEEGNEQYPASYDSSNIVAVMGTDHDDNRATGWLWGQSSNWGPISVDLAAPGTDILSTTPTCETELMQSEGVSTYYDTASGTSMATPHIAGACAIIWSVNPSLTHLEVKAILLSTVDDLQVSEYDRENLGIQDRYDYCVTGGRLNLHKAASAANNYTSPFCLKNNLGQRMAWFDNLGNLFLQATLTTGVDPLNEDPDHDEFRVQDSSEDIAIIDTTNGDMYIKGSLYEWQGTLAPSEQSSDFIIKSSSTEVVAYIDESGDLYLKGTLYEYEE